MNISFMLCNIFKINFFCCVLFVYVLKCVYECECECAVLFLLQIKSTVLLHLSHKGSLKGRISCLGPPKSPLLVGLRGRFGWGILMDRVKSCALPATPVIVT